MSDSTDIALSLWRAIDSRDWIALEGILGRDFEAVWPQSGERFDRAGYIDVNRQYPGEWSIHVAQTVDGGSCVVTEVEVTIDHRTDRAVSFLHISNGKVQQIREFWPDPFPIPEWRSAVSRRAESEDE